MIWLLFSCALEFKDCAFIAAVDQAQCRQAVITSSAYKSPMVCVGPNGAHMRSAFVASVK